MLNRYNGEEKLAIAGIMIFLTWALVVIAANVAIIWVIIHFISKYW